MQTLELLARYRPLSELESYIRKYQESITQDEFDRLSLIDISKAKLNLLETCIAEIDYDEDYDFYNEVNE